MAEFFTLLIMPLGALAIAGAMFFITRDEARAPSANESVASRTAPSSENANQERLIFPDTENYKMVLNETTGKWEVKHIKDFSTHANFAESRLSA